MVLSDDGRGWRRYFLAGWAFVECLLFAGILYGWGSLVYVLKDEGIYAHLCDDVTTSANYTVSSTNYDVSLIGNNATGVGKDVNSYDVSFNKSSVVVHAEDAYVRLNIPEMGNVTAGPGDVTNVSTSNNVGVGCKAQDGRFALCFTVGSAIFCASCFFMGHLNYKLGTRITRLIAFIIFIAGSLCLAFVNKDLPWLIYPGLTLIGVGGLPLLVTNAQVSNLFTTGSASVAGLLCGGYDMSSAVFLVIKLAYQRGVSRQSMYLGLTCMQLVTMISTWFFLPRGFIENRTVSQARGDRADRELRMSIGTADTLLVRRQSRARRPSIIETQTMGSYLVQPLFITHNIWICLLQLRFYYLIGNLNTYLNRTLEGDKQKVSYFTDVCFYTMMGGLLTSFLVGIVYDWQKRLFSGKHHSRLYRGLMPAILPLTTASVMSILFSVLVLIPVQSLLYVIFIVMVLCRSFLYSMAVAFISAIFPSQYFGIMYGLTILSAGLFGCLQYAFFEWTEAYEQGPFHADIALLCVAVLSLGHPIYMWICARREEREYLTSLK